eukprot:8316829-Heterocapsa_arctica.AAC.1
MRHTFDLTRSALLALWARNFCCLSIYLRVPAVLVGPALCSAPFGSSLLCSARLRSALCFA